MSIPDPRDSAANSGGAVPPYRQPAFGRPSDDSSDSVTESSGHAVQPQNEPTCARHPKVVSYVRCQRCELPTCPQCQRQAAVGIQCVDCVKTGQKSMRRPITVFGNELSENPPYVTFALIGLCVLVNLTQYVVGREFTGTFAMRPSQVQHDWWQPLTSGFLHDTGSPFHLILNMYGLWLFGPFIERAVGHGRFLLSYLTAIVGGSAVYEILVPSPDGAMTFALGASGGLFGLMGMVLLIQRRASLSNTGLWIVLGINVVLGFTMPRIAWQAHFGGFLAGVLCAFFMSYLPRSSRFVGSYISIVLLFVFFYGITIFVDILKYP